MVKSAGAILNPTWNRLIPIGSGAIRADSALESVYNKSASESADSPQFRLIKNRFKTDSESGESV